VPRSRKRSRRETPWIGRLAWSTGLGLIIFLCRFFSLPHEIEAPIGPAPTPNANWAADFPARIDQVTDAVRHLPLPLPTPIEEAQGAGALRWLHRRYELTVPAPTDSNAIAQTLAPVRAAAAGVTVQVTQSTSGAQAQVGIDGLLTHTLVFHWLGHRPRVAIIIDNLGNDLLIARELVDIDAPLTFAVMPARPFSRQVAELAALFQREVLLHLPMEAENGEDFGATGLLELGASRDDIRRQVDAALDTVPHAVGVNNHLGSHFTANAEHLQWVLERLREHGLFFIDSLATSHSVACTVAAAIALPCATRDLFLDDADDPTAIRAQLDGLLQLARTRGDAIGIGHGRPATLAALRAAVPGFAAAGVDIVSVSTVVTVQSLSRR
jgi:polysaccharide deacetylase 2 family uncharacterized protein YibQ